MAVGEVPGAPGLRGVLAARAFQQDETVISLPTRLAIGLGLQSFTAQVPWPDCLGAPALYIKKLREGIIRMYRTDAAPRQVAVLACLAEVLLGTTLFCARAQRTGS